MASIVELQPVNLACRTCFVNSRDETASFAPLLENSADVTLNPNMQSEFFLQSINHRYIYTHWMKKWNNRFPKTRRQHLDDYA